MAISPGSYLDRYKLIAQAGEGGQGSVWQALDERNQRTVALKLHQLNHQELGAVPRATNTSASTNSQRLRREADALRQLNHPSLVRCLGMFEDYERNILGIVLEWIDGQTLTQALKDPAFSSSHRMWLLGHLVRALAYLHQSEIVHRDLKFGNVIVTRAFLEQPSIPEHIKLVDLGVAAPVGNPNPLTVAGAFVGTSAYVAPEIVMRGKNPAMSASTASDVFALGVLGWRLLTGEHPAGLSLKADFSQFVAFYQVAQMGAQPWPARGSVEGPWGEVLLRCLRLDTQERPQSAVEIVDILEGRRPLRSAPEEEPHTQDDVTAIFNPSVAPVPPSGPSRAVPPASPPAHLAALPAARPSAPQPLTPTAPLVTSFEPLPERRDSRASMTPLPSSSSLPAIPAPDPPSGNRVLLIVISVSAALLLVGGLAVLFALRR